MIVFDAGLNPGLSHFGNMQNYHVSVVKHLQSPGYSHLDTGVPLAEFWASQEAIVGTLVCMHHLEEASRHSSWKTFFCCGVHCWTFRW